LAAQILYELNPQEALRADKKNFSIPPDPNLRKLKVLHHRIGYPDMEDNWPGFFI